MQNQGRFGETKLSKIIFFCAFGIFLTASTRRYVAELKAGAMQPTRKDYHQSFEPAP